MQKQRRVSAGFAHWLSLGTATMHLAIGAQTVNHVLSLSGSTDYVEIPDSGSLDLVDQFTLEAWVNFTELSVGSQTVIAKRRIDFGTGYALQVAGGKAVLGLNNDVPGFPGQNYVLTTGPELVAKDWHHIAASYDGATARLYVDGVGKASDLVSMELRASEFPVTIGQEALPGDPRPFLGLLDEVRVWNRALSEQEISVNLWRTLAGNEPGLVGYWKFDNGTATDGSAYANHGRLVGQASIVAQSTPFPGPSILIGPLTNSASSHLYYLLNPSSWTAAEAKAQELGGHLATVNDQAENDWLLATFAVDRNLWIGLNDAQQEGVFVWSSGQPVAFVNWNPGEPNNNVGGEAYVELLGAGNGKWNDLPNDHPNMQVYGVAEVAPQAACVAPPPGLIGWWPGDGHTNDLAGDHGAIPVNATFAAGLVGQAFTFTGNGSHVRVPYNSAFAALTNSLSLEAWVWLNGTDRIQRLITLSPDNAFLACAAESFTFALALGHSAPVHHVLTATNKVERDRWYHLAATYDGSVQALYVDGDLAATAEIGPPLRPIGQGAAPELFISFLGEQALDGLIDEVAVHNRALDAAEVQSHFAAGPAGMCKQPRIADIAVFFPGTARLEVKGPPSRELQVQRSSDLINWSLLSTIIDFTGRSQVFDVDAGTAQWRFYRAAQTR